MTKNKQNTLVDYATTPFALDWEIPFWKIKHEVHNCYAKSDRGELSLLVELTKTAEKYLITALSSSFKQQKTQDNTMNEYLQWGYLTSLWYRQYKQNTELWVTGTMVAKSVTWWGGGDTAFLRQIT